VAGGPENQSSSKPPEKKFTPIAHTSRALGFFFVSHSANHSLSNKFAA
jgi:hypothetical protein